MANLKRDHGWMFDRLSRAVAGEKLPPSDYAGGTLNKKFMHAATSLLLDWSTENRKRFLGLLEQFREVGHFCLKGPRGVTCESGAPGMHYSYTMAAILAVYLWVSLRLEKHVKEDDFGPATEKDRQAVLDQDLLDACETVLLGEMGLSRHYRFGDRVVLPCPRGKDDAKSGPMPPMDAYRDVVVALGLGEKVKRQAKWWSDPLALAPRLMRELVDRGIWDSRLQAEARDADVPLLYLEIHWKEIPGGWIAWLPDDEKTRKAVGRDGLTWVRCSPEGITWGYDFSPLPQEVA